MTPPQVPVWIHVCVGDFLTWARLSWPDGTASIITGISYFRLSLEEQRLAQANEKRSDVTL